MMKRNNGLIILLFLLIPGFLLQGAPIGLSIPDTSGFRGDYIDLPIEADSSFSGENVSSFHLEITFSDNLLEFEEVIIAGTLTETLGFYEYNQTAEGRIQIAAAGNSPLEGEGILLKLRFFMEKSGTVYINFTGSENNYFNEGLVETILDNGHISILEPPKINISPDNRLLTVGDTHQFNVSGGSAPYTWDVTNSAVAEISSTGLLSATHHGFTRVAVEDNGSIRDTTTGDVEIRAYKIWTNDTSLYQGESILIPLRISDLTGLGVTSGKVEFSSFNGGLLEAFDISTEGTLLQSYDKPSFKSETGKLKIAFAGSEPLEGAGILCFVHFQTKMESQGITNLIMADPLFNEVLLGNVINGKCRVLSLSDLNVNPATSLPPMDEMLPGYTLQFRVSGGIEPYSWGTTDPEVAVVDENGLLTAISGGVVTVQVEDSIGAKGSSRLITVYDTEISIRDTSINREVYCILPVRMRALHGDHELFAFEASIQIDTSILKELEIITDGALCDEGWNLVNNYVDGNYKIAGATSSSVTGGGILFYIRFIIPNDAPNVTRTHLTFKSLMLNEGTPSALASDGTIIINTTSISDPYQHSVADGFLLYQNYPNPFNPITKIPFQLDKKSYILFEVFSSSGERITSIEKQYFGPGLHSIDWNGEGMSSGVYYYIMWSGSSKQVKKMILVR